MQDSHFHLRFPTAASKGLLTRVIFGVHSQHSSIPKILTALSLPPQVALSVMAPQKLCFKASFNQLILWFSNQPLNLLDPLPSPVQQFGSPVLASGLQRPVGLTWNLAGLHFDEMHATVQAHSTKGTKAFVSTLKQHRDAFTEWLAIATSAPKELALYAVP
jgi:hypothetical protein